GLRLEDLPTTAEGEAELASVLCGAASGDLRFERAGMPDRPLTGRGRITVAEPVYLFTRRYAPDLARYGLPAVHTRGKGPLTATLRVERDELVIEPLTAAVEGIDVGGGARLGEGGRLVGRVEIHLRESYLMSSPLLAIPGAFAGAITI